MWDKLVLTAGSESQNEIFREQLAKMPMNGFSEAIEVVTDESPGLRIGSGGATLSVIRNAIGNKNNGDLKGSKILLVHSGGLSQRMPHLSAYGKVFSLLPNRKTILETKLNIYKKDLIDKLSQAGGIMITASDVIENMETAKSIKSNPDVVVFAHVSSVDIGTQHGVFVIDKKTNKLRRVLQKPTLQEMEKEGAIRDDGKVLTDSCFFLSWNICKRILENPILRDPVTEELCCYGDFMRPMGYDPKLDYIESSSAALSSYRKALADVFRTATVEISVLGEKSFFHFGTYDEYLESILPTSDFRDTFPGDFKSNIIFCTGMRSIPSSSFVEYSAGSPKVGQRCVVSGVNSENREIMLPSNTLTFTMALKMKKYVSVIIMIDEDIKKKSDRVIWNCHDTRINEKSMWDAPIFQTCETRVESLEATLGEWENGIVETVTERVSIAEAVKMHDFGMDLKWRCQLSSLQRN